MGQQTGQKMLSVKPSFGEWDNKFSNRREQVFINRQELASGLWWKWTLIIIIIIIII